MTSILHTSYMRCYVITGRMKTLISTHFPETWKTVTSPHTVLHKLRFTIYFVSEPINYLNLNLNPLGHSAGFFLYYFTARMRTIVWFQTISSGCGWLGIASWPVSWYIKIYFFSFFLFTVKGRDVTTPDWSLTKSKLLVLSRMIISDYGEWSLSHDDVIKWKHFPCYWPFVLVTGHRWIPLTNASDAEVWCFPWSAPE